jgi:FkbM family methyltransferase
MHVELLVVGAHNGIKLEREILKRKDRGAIVLVEPVPFLFAQLQARFADVPNIFLAQACVAPRSGPTVFFAPRPEAGALVPGCDQLGSLRSNHALRHDPGLKDHIERIEVEGVTVAELVDRFQITSLQHLLTDTEGYDCVLLQEFPFLKLRPKTITFEFKHADGAFTVGRTLALLLLKLDALGYVVRAVDSENFHAISRI